MMKHILSVELNLLKGQFIDNIIISTFYAVIRLSGMENCTFNQIISE